MRRKANTRNVDMRATATATPSGHRESDLEESRYLAPSMNMTITASRPRTRPFARDRCLPSVARDSRGIDAQAQQHDRCPPLGGRHELTSPTDE
jgi:hypothetical protein